MKKDIYNLHLALTNNIDKISFSSQLDPIITPKQPSELIIKTIEEYILYFENAEPSMSIESEIVEYYILKYKMKSFENLIEDFEGFDEEKLWMVQINEYLCNGNDKDLYLADFFAAQYFEGINKEYALRFYEEGERVACERGNEHGMLMCRNRYEELIREIDSEE